MRFVTSALRSFIFIITCSITSSSTQGMLSKWKYQPHVQPDNSDITEKRKAWVTSFANRKRIMTSDDENDHTCGYYALKKITESTNFKILEIGKPEFTALNVEKFFDQTQKPNIGDLAVWTTSKTDLTIQHYGVVSSIPNMSDKFDINNILVISKWGQIPNASEGKVFDIPYMYGSSVGFFRLKPKYATDQGKKLLDKKIKATNSKMTEKNNALNRLQQLSTYNLLAMVGVLALYDAYSLGKYLK